MATRDISRREALAHVFSSTLAASAVATAGGPASAAALAHLAGPAAALGRPAVRTVASSPMVSAIEAHKVAYAEWYELLNQRDVWEVEWLVKSRALAETIGDVAQRAEERDRRYREDGYAELDRIECEASQRENELLAALIRLPPRSLVELREKVEYLQTMPDGDSAFSIIENPMMTFMESIIESGLITGPMV